MGRPIIIAGMHRSGTSLLANLLMEAGVAMGPSLQPASASNARGHFEDLDFQHLHRDILADTDPMLLYTASADMQIPVDARHVARARELVRARSDQPVWGWKDPRTTLFLDLWLEVVPEARFVFIFRAPELVVSSLRRRGDPELVYRYPWAWFWLKVFRDRFRSQSAARMWREYNRRVLDFIEHHPGRCLLLEVERLLEQFPEAVRIMRDRWDLPLRDVDVQEVLDPRLLSARAPWWLTLQTRWRPSIGRTYRRLRRLAVWPPSR